MKNKIIKEVTLTSRIDIIHNNFFKYLKKKGITQHKYSLDNNIPESTISKWRKGIDSHMNEEHIIQAAKYFNISVNMLFYTEQELKELKFKDDDNMYEPVLAQEHIKVKLLSNSFKNPLNVVYTTSGLALILAFIIFLIVRNYNEYWSLLALIIPIGGAYYFKDEFGIEKTYSINYLDDIYYKIDEQKNQYIKIIDLIHIFINILSILLNIILLFTNSYSNKEIKIKVLIFISIIVFLIISNGTLLFRQRKFKKEIYPDELSNYRASLVNYYISITLSTLMVSLLCIDFCRNGYYLFFIIIFPIISYIEFMLVSKKYSEYKLVYFDQKNNKIIELFHNNDEK